MLESVPVTSNDWVPMITITAVLESALTVSPTVDTDGDDRAADGARERALRRGTARVGEFAWAAIDVGLIGRDLLGRIGGRDEPFAEPPVPVFPLPLVPLPLLGSSSG